MSDFYIKLPSNGSKQEYPNNKSNSFKIRLPEPIRLGPDWRVGLMSIPLPDTNGVLPKFTLNDDPLFTMKWFVTKKKLGEPSRESPTFRVKQREENFTSQNLSVTRKITFGINKHLCHQMKWILENDDETYQLGPNLKMEINGAKIPDPDESGEYEDLQT